MFSSHVFGHRGVSSEAPENTMAAFHLAVQQGVKAVEFDVMQASDGTLFIFHDDTLDRTSDGRGEFKNQSSAYLKTLDAGSWFHQKFSGERIPTLLEVVSFLAENHVVMNIELKPQAGDEERFITQLLIELKLYLHTINDSMIFSSFSLPALETLRKHCKTCLIGLLLDEWRSDWQEKCDELKAVSVHLSRDIASPKHIDAIKLTDKHVLVYTVNDQHEAKRLFNLGVTAVFSDQPSMILKS